MKEFFTHSGYICLWSSLVDVQIRQVKSLSNCEAFLTIKTMKHRIWFKTDNGPLQKSSNLEITVSWYDANPNKTLNVNKYIISCLLLLMLDLSFVNKHQKWFACYDNYCLWPAKIHLWPVEFLNCQMFTKISINPTLQHSISIIARSLLYNPTDWRR